MKDTIEKLFFSIVRVLFFIVALGAFLVLIFATVYLSKLYFDTTPKSTRQDTYTPKKPEVTFDTYKVRAKEILNRDKELKEHIRSYVNNVIKNGSNGHGYQIKAMPGGLIGNLEADEVSVYIANKLSTQRPDAFKACIACHGEDAKGNNEQAPDLYKLPIYHGIRARVNNGQVSNKDYANYPKEERSEFDQYIDRLILSINKYASKTAQPGAQRDEIVQYIQQQTGKYDFSNSELFKMQFEKGLEQLDNFAKDYNEFSNSSPMRIKPVNWKYYLKWFAEDYSEQVSMENAKLSEIEARNAQRRNAARGKAMRAKAKLSFVLTIAGGALVVFILATMLLILVRIEFNTRNYNVDGDEG